MSIYLKAPNIEGDVEQPGYKGWIALDGFKFNNKRSVKMVIGNSTLSERRHGILTFLPLTVTKQMDVASPKLFENINQGIVMPTVEIHVTDEQGEKIKYTLSDVIISERDIIADGELAPLEILTLCYSEIEESYIQREANNKLSSPYKSGYNLERAVNL